MRGDAVPTHRDIFLAVFAALRTGAGWAYPEGYCCWDSRGRLGSMEWTIRRSKVSSSGALYSRHESLFGPANADRPKSIPCNRSKQN